MIGYPNQENQLDIDKLWMVAYPSLVVDLLTILGNRLAIRLHVTLA